MDKNLQLCHTIIYFLINYHCDYIEKLDFSEKALLAHHLLYIKNNLAY